MISIVKKNNEIITFSQIFLLGLMMLGIGICLYVLSEIIFFTIFRDRRAPKRRTTRDSESTIVSIDSPTSAKRPSMKLLKPTLESILESQELVVTQKRETWHFEPFVSIQDIHETSEEDSGFEIKPKL